jgi:hypothetical protein
MAGLAKACTAEPSMHDLRRPFVRRAVWSGIEGSVVMRLVGHRNGPMLARNNFIDAGVLRAAADLPKCALAAAFGHKFGHNSRSEAG